MTFMLAQKMRRLLVAVKFGEISRRMSGVTHRVSAGRSADFGCRTMVTV